MRNIRQNCHGFPVQLKLGIPYFIYTVSPVYNVKKVLGDETIPQSVPLFITWPQCTIPALQQQLGPEFRVRQSGPNPRLEQDHWILGFEIMEAVILNKIESVVSRPQHMIRFTQKINLKSFIHS